LPALDDLLTEVMTRLAPPADTAGVVERLVARKAARHRRARKAKIGVAVLAATIALSGLVIVTGHSSGRSHLRVASGPRSTTSTSETAEASGPAAASGATPSVPSGQRGSRVPGGAASAPTALPGIPHPPPTILPSSLHEWRLQKGGVSAYRVKFVDPLHGWAATDLEVLGTTDGGLTWKTEYRETSTVIPPAPSSPAKGLLTFVDASHGWVVDNNGRVWATSDGGSTWAAKGVLPQALRAMSFVDALHGWVVGTGGQILATSDGGATWVNQDSHTTYGLSGVDFVDARHGWVVGTVDIVLATSDGGATWVTQHVNPNPAAETEYNAVDFVDLQHGWAGGTDGIIATDDGGQTWKARGVFPLDISFADPLHGWAVGAGSSSADNATVLGTSDGGATWVREKIDSIRTIWGVSAVDPSHVWAVGYDGIFVRTPPVG